MGTQNRVFKKSKRENVAKGWGLGSGFLSGCPPCHIFVVYLEDKKRVPQKLLVP